MNVGIQSSGHSSNLVQHDFLNSSAHKIQAWTFDFWFGRKRLNFNGYMCTVNQQSSFLKCCDATEQPKPFQCLCLWS